MYDFDIVAREGTWSFTADGGAAGTPELLLDWETGVYRVEATFDAQGDFYYEIKAINANPFVLNRGKLPTGGVVVARGWHPVTRSAFFLPQAVPFAFSVSFIKGDLSGVGKLSNFILSSERVMPF